MIVGIDEVGRGAWAGPMAVGAVLLGGASITGLTDSKKLTKKQRKLLDIEIRQKATAIGIGWVSAKEIDTIGLSPALKLASRRALAQIRHDYREIIIDGTITLIDDPRVTLMKKADLLVPSVSAASIVAKVARDNYMKHLDGVFPGYRFTGHVGYGTAAHRAAIETLGVTPLHRLSFSPLQKYAQEGDLSRSQLPSTSSQGHSTGGFASLWRLARPEGDILSNKSIEVARRMRSERFERTTKQIGDLAETETANYLIRFGHKIIARNWRTKFCEIDIISTLGGTVYFTEVKYRKSDKQGGGFAAITAKKQQQMAFAAEYYAVKNKLTDANLVLAAADVTGSPPQVVEFLTLA